MQAVTGHAVHVTSGRRGPVRQAAAMYNSFANNSSQRYATQAVSSAVRDAYCSGRHEGLAQAAEIDKMAGVP